MTLRLVTLLGPKRSLRLARTIVQRDRPTTDLSRRRLLKAIPGAAVVGLFLVSGGTAAANSLFGGARTHDGAGVSRYGLTISDLSVTDNTTNAAEVVARSVTNPRMVALLRTLTTSGIRTSSPGRAQKLTFQYNKAGRSNPTVDLVRYDLSDSRGAVGAAYFMSGQAGAVVFSADRRPDGALAAYMDTNGTPRYGLRDASGHTSVVSPAVSPGAVRPDSACTDVCSIACAGGFNIGDVLACIEGCSVTGPARSDLCSVVRCPHRGRLRPRV